MQALHCFSTVGRGISFVSRDNFGKREDALRKEEIYTIEDIYALPEGQRAELIDGKIYYMAPPNTRHQMLVMDLSYQIKDYIKRNNGECDVFPAPFAVFLNENDKNYVEPDISVICDKDKITFGEDVPVGIYEGFTIKVK